MHYVSICRKIGKIEISITRLLERRRKIQEYIDFRKNETG